MGTHNLLQVKAQPYRVEMAGVNTEAVKSLDFIVKAVLWLVLLITMAMVTSNSVCVYPHIKIGHLVELSSLGFFFFYLLQIATLLGGEKIPCIMGILTAVFGAIFNFCCAVVVIKDGRGACSLTTSYGTTMTYGAFSLIAIPLFVIDAGLAFKNKTS